MVSPIIFKNDSLARGIETAGSALGSALGERAQESRERERYKKDATTLQQILSKASANPSLQEVQQIQLEALQAGVSPVLIKSMIDMYTPYLTENVKSQGTDNLLNRLGIRGSGGKEQDTSQRQQFTQLDEYEPEGMYAQRQQSPGLEQPKEASPITTVKKAQAFAKAPVEKQKEFIRGQGETALSNMSDSNLLELSMSRDPALKNAVDTELKIRSQTASKFESDRDYHAKRLVDTEKKVAGMRASLPKKKYALKLSREANDSGEIGALSLNNLAERLGLPELRSAKGAQLVTASKEQFLSNMSRVSAKGQTQFYEQRLLDMLPKIGQSQEANDTVQNILEGELEMDDLYLKTYSQLEQEDMDRYGYVRSDIENRVDKILEEPNEKIFNKTSYKLREVLEREKGTEWLRGNVLKKVPKGTYLTPEMAKIFSEKYGGDIVKGIENAEKLGYQTPTEEENNLWQ